MPSLKESLDERIKHNYVTYHWSNNLSSACIYDYM